MVLVWQITGDSPNSLNFLPAKLSHYAVCYTKCISCSRVLQNQIDNPNTVIPKIKHMAS